MGPYGCAGRFCFLHLQRGAANHLTLLELVQFGFACQKYPHDAPPDRAWALRLWA